MAQGKEIGDFSLKMSTFVNVPGGSAGVLRQVTWEGPVTGFGTLFVTVTFSGSGKAGTFTDCSTAFMDNGDFLHGVGQGNYESKGAHIWHTKGFTQLSDGRRIEHEGNIRLTERSWDGKVFELS
jgi:hypothetical protein